MWQNFCCSNGRVGWMLLRRTPPGIPSFTFSFKQCCGSGMFIPDPDFFPSRIPDPKTALKERGEKN
jgi:hypothetical protein